MDVKMAEGTLLEVGGILDFVGVPFFLTYGTCLGVYRDGRLIAHDEDIDLGALAEHVTPVASALAERFAEAGFGVRVITNPCGYPRAIVIRRGADHVDIAGFIRNGGSRFSPSTYNNCSYVYPAAMLETTEWIDYLGREWRVPSPIEKYLALQYGAGWRKVDKRWRATKSPAYKPDYYRKSVRGAA